MSKVINLQAIQQARANLKALAQDHPRLLGPSTPEAWEQILSAALTTSQRQRELRQRRQASGLRKATLWASEADLEALRQRYPGPRGGIDWQTIIMTALERKP